ncbi:hypothetical protein BDQ12DRAFT_727285 [Crucibulum laeve]|uniref:F-box domain-containing protein n=1 Tax=Crucibulum laeve TaxID=68775 RepID=A0A5C3LNV3_9AGAR|nr:hypothetical protein BDQ12DRAFT_727285 [Crucibulum laeve]
MDYTTLENPRKINLTAPISKLPSELLSSIFLLLDFGSPDYGRRTRYISPAREMLAVTQICHYWREVALECHSLWSRALYLAFPNNWFRELLRRSGTSPIDAFGPIQELQGYSENLSTVLNHVARLRTLRVNASSQSWSLLTNRLQERSAPLLEYLHLERDNNIRISPRFSASIFKGHSPRLRKLELHGCVIDIKSPVFRNLTMLKIFDVHAVLPFSVQEWLDLFERMPSLKELSLHDRSPRKRSLVISSPSGLENAVTLPNLSALTIGSLLEPCSALLYHMITPSLAFFNVSCVATYPGIGFERLRASLASKFVDVQQPTEDRSYNLILGKSRFCFFTSEEPGYRISSGSAFNISVYWEIIVNGFTALVPHIMSILEPFISQVTSLRLDFDMYLPPHLSTTQSRAVFLELLYPFKKLRKLHLLRGEVDILPYLQPLLHDHARSSRSPNDENHLLLPSLRTLSLNARGFGMVNPAEPDMLSAFVRARSQMQSPLEIVEFHGDAELSDVKKNLEELGVVVYLKEQDVDLQWSADGW